MGQKSCVDRLFSGVERKTAGGGAQKVNDRTSSPPARVLPVQNSRKTVFCGSAALHKRHIRATTRYADCCRRPDRLLCRSSKIPPPPHKKRRQENIFSQRRHFFFQKTPFSCENIHAPAGVWIFSERRQLREVFQTPFLPPPRLRPKP